ncbi:hypothetical protein [Streptomyces sp. NPDC046887]|uniref:hypothetical protein n=1 Tax=Streptomyces sp. NPDC046887 TaxID=3155472 RepID=UPI0033EEB467
MRATLIRRTALAASVASLTLLATACGSSDGGDGKDGSSKPAPKALSAAELEKAIITKDDVKGYKVEKLADQLKEQGKVAVDKGECQAIADTMSLKALGKPAGTAQRQATKDFEKPSLEGASPEEIEKALKGAMSANTYVTLASYQDKGAEEALTSLKSAGTACAGGFGGTSDGEKVTLTKIVESPATGGDEAGSWTVFMDMEGKEVPFYQLTAVRKGSTLATFGTINLSAVMGKGGEAEKSTEVIDAQVKKLG